MYDRWGMTADAALALTGETVTDADLEAAEADIADVLGRTQDPTLYADDDERVRLFGRAVAWQAAYRAVRTPKATDAPAAVTSESIGGGDYSVTYAKPQIDNPTLAPRARSLLVRGGWIATVATGTTRA